MVDHKRLRVAEIANELKVTPRTVYTLIEREKWEKEVGRAGKVWYYVPVKFIKEYLEAAQVDQGRSQLSLHTASQLFSEGSRNDNDRLLQEQSPPSQRNSEATVTFTDDQFLLIIGDKDTRIEELKLALAEKDKLLEEIRLKLETALNRVNRLEGEMSGKDAVIAAKDEALAKADIAINASNAAVLIYEQYKAPPALEAKMPEPEQQPEIKPPKLVIFGKTLIR